MPCGRRPAALALAARSQRETRVADHLGTIPSSFGRPPRLARSSVGPNRRWQAGIALEQSAAVVSSMALTTPRQRRGCLFLTLGLATSSPPPRKEGRGLPPPSTRFLPPPPPFRGVCSPP